MVGGGGVGWRLFIERNEGERGDVHSLLYVLHVQYVRMEPI